MRKKGFTLVELLVVIAIIALLMGILMPALARVRQIAFRMVCGTNLSGIGKAMLLYANDYEDLFPVAGTSQTYWGVTGDVVYNAITALDAFKAGTSTITSCFYLLVKYAEVTPKSFICKGDTEVSEFEVGDDTAGVQYDLTALWDFGPRTNTSDPLRHCSYSYHQPLRIGTASNQRNPFGLSTTSEPGLVVAADPNPWLTESSGRVWDSIPLYGDYEFDPGSSSRDEVRAGNTHTHQDDGQNVMYLDSHVSVENSSACGINEDNIYTPQSTLTTVPIALGIKPTAPGSMPTERDDSYLVNDARTTKRTCFLPNTLVWVDGAFVPISQVAVGQAAGTSNNAIVEKLQEHVGTYECRDITLASGKCISVVETHLFMLESGLWVASQNLKSGMKLRTMNGSIAIESVTKREAPYVGKVYNVKVSNTDQYMVGEDAVIVRDY